tara:strand:- start:5630 stop:6730 length:1101 start_codon:yes stop_codon:yes gene_type:complete
MKEKNKVIIYYPSYEKGGIAKILINLINFFVKNNFEIFLFSQNVEKNKLKNTKYIKIIDVENPKFFPKKFLGIYFSLILSMKMFFFLKKYKKKITILSMQNHLLSIPISILTNSKIIVRNSEEIFGATKYADSKIYAYLVFFFKVIFYQFAEKIIALSVKSQLSLEKIIWDKKKINLIYNPYLSKIRGFKIKKLNKPFRIVSAGRLTKQKNFKMLIDAVIFLVDNGHNLKLTIIGSGPLEKYLRSQTKNYKYIKLISWQKDIEKHLSKNDLFILPSLYEGSPNILLDSLNINLPALTSDCSGAKDIFSNQSKLIFKVDDKKDLIKKLKFCLLNKNKMNNQLKISRKNLKKFLISNCSKYTDLINQI